MKRLAALFLAAVVLALVVVTQLVTMPAYARTGEFCYDGIDRVPAANQARLNESVANPSPGCDGKGGPCVDGPGPGNSGNTPAPTAGPNK